MWGLITFGANNREDSLGAGFIVVSTVKEWAFGLIRKQDQFGGHAHSS